MSKIGLILLLTDRLRIFEPAIPGILAHRWDNPVVTGFVFWAIFYRPIVARWREVPRRRTTWNRFALIGLCGIGKLEQSVRSAKLSNHG